METRNRPLTWRQKLRRALTGDPYASPTHANRRELAEAYQRDGIPVEAHFHCAAEVHNREAFQQGAGRFLSTDRPFLADGRIDFRDERKPESPDVWILSLKSPAHGAEVLRIQAPTRIEAQERMGEAIVNQFWSWCYQAAKESFDRAAFERLTRDHGTLMQFLQKNGHDPLKIIESRAANAQQPPPPSYKLCPACSTVVDRWLPLDSVWVCQCATSKIFSTKTEKQA